MNLELLFLTPSIHELPTGGNIYNRRIIEALEDIEGIRVEYNTLSRDGDNIRNLDDFDAVIVDSLIAGIERPAEYSGVWCLLVHYLTICDPSASEVEKRRLEREWLKEYDGFITTSHYTRHCLAKAGASPDQVYVVYPGMEEVYRTHDMPAIQSADTCKMVTVASLLPGKGLLDCLELLEPLAHLPWTWDIIGEGSLNPGYTQFFMERVGASTVADRVFWEGPLEERLMPEMYRSHDLLLVPSHFETLGMSIREAMASGVPVLAYEVGGIGESLVGGGGIMIDAFHKDRYQEEIARLLVSPDERSALGEDGLEQSKRFPSWEVSASLLADAIEKLVSTQ